MSNNKYKVLIVDDEANIRSFIGAILESNGYQVLTAATCAQGQMMFASHRPDLILLDLGLPDEDGSALIRTVRGRGSPAPVLVLRPAAMKRKRSPRWTLAPTITLQSRLAPANFWPGCAPRCATPAPGRRYRASGSRCAG